MTLSFPRDLIEPLRVRSAPMALYHLQARNSARGGQIQAVSLGPSIWTIRYETVLLTYAQGLDWEAWIDSLRGGLRTFKAWHPLRQYASSYPAGYGGMTRAGGGSFDGTCTRSAIGGGFDTVTLTTLPAGFVLKSGDMMSWTHAGGINALHRVVEDATASGSGQVTATVEPLVRASPAGSTVSLVKPWFTAVIDAGNADVKWQPGKRAVATIEARQTL